jgi:hypothetical protein
MKEPLTPGSAIKERLTLSLTAHQELNSTVEQQPSLLSFPLQR